MVSARAKRVLRNVWKHTSPGLRAYGKQFAGVVDAEIGRRTAGTSYGALIPSATSFIPGNGLSLAGRGAKRVSSVMDRRGNRVRIPAGYIARRASKKKHVYTIWAPVKQGWANPEFSAAVDRLPVRRRGAPRRKRVPRAK